MDNYRQHMGVSDYRQHIGVNFLRSIGVSIEHESTTDGTFVYRGKQFFFKFEKELMNLILSTYYVDFDLSNLPENSHVLSLTLFDPQKAAIDQMHKHRELQLSAAALNFLKVNLPND